MGENAMYRLDDDEHGRVMVRIGRSWEAAQKEVNVASWLAAHDFPAVRVAGRWEQPVAVNGLAVTFWEFIEAGPDRPTSDDLARVLRALHALPPPSSFKLPPFEPMPKVAGRLQRLRLQLPDDDLSFLRQRHETLEKEFAQVTFGLPTGPIHSDAHNGNLIRGRDGVVKLIDFEDFAYGPREWDAAMAAVRYQALGWLTKDEYESYAAIYGFDALAWPGFPVVRDIRELNMTTWLAQRLGASPDIDDEVRRRLSDLRDSQAVRRWRAF